MNYGNLTQAPLEEMRKKNPLCISRNYNIFTFSKLPYLPLKIKYSQSLIFPRWVCVRGQS